MCLLADFLIINIKLFRGHINGIEINIKLITKALFSIITLISFDANKNDIKFQKIIFFLLFLKGIFTLLQFVLRV